MTVNEAYLICFSPTCTSKQVGEYIVQGMGIKNVYSIDLTLKPIDDVKIPSSAIAVIVVPVYGGHVAPLAMERLQSIRASNTPTVVVVVYGNRAYEEALTELDGYATEHGFKVIAGATFIGEHSYSTDKHPIAKGRPNELDLGLADTFGGKVMDKLQKVEDEHKLLPIDVREIERPQQAFLPMLRFMFKVIKLRRSGKPMPKAPSVNENLCIHCGICVAHCPVGAIIKGDELHSNAEKCIKCCACVKACPKHARTFDTPFAALLSDCFKKQKLPQSIL